MRFLNGGEPTPREEIRGQVQRLLGYYERFDGFGFWAAQEKATGRFLGWFQFRPRKNEPPDGEIELGYRLRRSAWGKGYATEGARALIRKGFTELGVERAHLPPRRAGRRRRLRARRGRVRADQS